MRTALQFDIAGYRLFGTMHDHTPSSPSQRLGVLLLSFGQQPRSWVGDLGSSIADRLDAGGYPTFRFDMPGLGDSPGEIPVYLEDLWREILLGAHENPLHALSKELVNRFSLKGLVIGGFCGGAITAIYSVNARSSLLKGLVLLEPEMALVRSSSTLPENKPPPLTIDEYQEGVELVWKRLTSTNSWRRLMSGKADLKFWFKLWSGLGNFFTQKFNMIGKHSINLPLETNLRMLDSWNLARRLRIPTLVITVGSPNRNKYYRAYGLEPGVINLRTGLHWVEIPNTTHAMLTGGAKNSVGEYFENWLHNNYPLKI